MIVSRLRPIGKAALRAAFCWVVLAAGSAAAEQPPPRGKPVKQAPVPPGGRAGAWEMLDSAEWPWTSVGRVNVVFGLSARGSCTGALVGPRLVLTAAHCLVNPKTRVLVQPAQVVFQIGYRRGRDLGHAPVAQIIASPRFSFTQRPNGPAAASNDWALLVLGTSLPQKPLPLRVLPYEDIARLAADGAIFQAGYGMERQHVLSIARNCKAQGDRELRVILHTCLSNFGYSGAPLMANTAAGPIVIGVGSLADLGRSGVASPAERFEAEAAANR